MSQIPIPAHVDGERILLDALVRLEPDADLLVTVVPKHDPERDRWFALSMQRLEDAYGKDEPEYDPDSVREVNPCYAGR